MTKGFAGATKKVLLDEGLLEYFDRVIGMVDVNDDWPLSDVNRRG